MEPKTISQTPLSLVELRHEIERIRQRVKEPCIRVTRTEDYLNAFVEISPEQGKELNTAIGKLAINRLKDEHICKIIDLLPRTAGELKLIMQGYALSLTNEASNKIIELVNDFLSKK